MSPFEWYRIDNVSKVFLATFNKRNTRCIRVSATLKERIDPELLQRALDTVITFMPHFQVRIRRGLFWHYIDSTDQKPKVEKENGRLCPLLYGEHYKGILHYKVTYYENRITMEVFHVLTDGTGAYEFLHALVSEYLRLAHPLELSDMSSYTQASVGERTRDSYEQFYEKNNTLKSSIPRAKVRAYHIQGRKLPYFQLQFMEVHLPADIVVRRAKQLSVTPTAYLGAMMMLAIKTDMPYAKRKQPITITLPVNLRRFYDSDSARNFINNVNISHTFLEDIAFDELALEFDRKLHDLLNKDLIKAQMNEYAKLEHFLFTRMVPLLLKMPVIKYFAKQEEKTVSAVLSNLGVINVPDEIKKYIEGYSIYCSYEGFFTAVSTYENDMVMGISYTYINKGVLRNLIKMLRDDDIPVSIYMSEVVQ